MKCHRQVFFTVHSAAEAEIGRKTELEAYEAPWRNRNHQLYEQYCYEDELPPKLKRLIKRYGKAFDDYWQFFKAKHRRPQRQVIIRRPLWMKVSTTERLTDKAKYGKGRQVQLDNKTLHKC